MIKLLFFIFFILLSINKPAFAQSNSFVTVVNPVRGEEFWDLKDQKPQDAVNGQLEILTKNKISATWLLRSDALSNHEIVFSLKNAINHEKGLFLEVIPSLTTKAKVNYRKSKHWHMAGSVFLTGYSRQEREKIIDAAFDSFKQTFGFYPKSVGAWWIDGHSLSYMQEKYGVTSSLIVADQFSTDNYQIWGQYFGTPYYPDKDHNLNPAQNKESKLPVVIVQWANRDPINGYGKVVEDSTYSVQANDYVDYHKLKTDYFGKLVDIYTKQQFNNFGHLVVGLENSYSWNKYKNEYENQIKVLLDKKNKSQFSLTTLNQFSEWYRNKFSEISPQHVIMADDPLGSEKKAIWFMNPYYRALALYDGNDFSIVDLRQYVKGEKELCREEACEQINFANFATRVLDNVTYGHKWQIDSGRIKNLNIKKDGDKIIIEYLNHLEKVREIEFLPRDIAVDGNISTIDGVILNATQKSKNFESENNKQINYLFSLSSFNINLVKFLIFIILFIFIPGKLLTNNLTKNEDNVSQIFSAAVVGIVLFTIISYLSGFLKIWWIVYFYIFFMMLLFLKFNLFKFSFKLMADKWIYLNFSIILLGVIFQNIPVFRSGTISSLGLGFWGPNSHDGIWHIALINQIIKGLPPQNPIFSGENLSNYHYFYDLLVGITFIITQTSILDLIFRFYPILFSVLLGLGTYSLTKKIFGSNLATFLSLFFVYFTGSLGWIVEYIREKHFGGESAFWVNQPVSFNLNPPFAISLILVIAVINLMVFEKKNIVTFSLLTLLAGVLIGFKAYASILVISAIFILGIYKLIKEKSFYFLKVFSGSVFLSFLILLPNYQFKNLFFSASNTFIFMPFWFIHSMIDSADRVGWVRLSLARTTSLEQGNWFKFILSEFLGLLIFIGGNLGVRIFALTSFLKINFLKNSGYIFIIVLTSLSLIVPILFIQVGNPWNTIQFFYYGLYTTAVLLGGGLAYFYFKLAFPLNILLIISVILIAPINAITTAKSYLYPFPHTVIGTGELEGLRILSNKEEGVVLTYPYDREARNILKEPLPLFAYETTAYVSALSGKQTFVSDEIQNEILKTNYKERLDSSRTFFKDLDAGFLQKNNIRYIYIPTYFKKIIDEGELIKKIYENNEVLIYEVGG